MLICGFHTLAGPGHQFQARPETELWMYAKTKFFFLFFFWVSQVHNCFFLVPCFVSVDVLWAVVVLAKESRGWREWQEKSLCTHGHSKGCVLLAGLWNDPSQPPKELPNSWATLRWHLESPRVFLLLSLLWLVCCHKLRGKDVQDTMPWGHYEAFSAPVKPMLPLRKQLCHFPWKLVFQESLPGCK